MISIHGTLYSSSFHRCFEISSITVGALQNSLTTGWSLLKDSANRRIR